jgi:UPF0755 protein
MLEHPALSGAITEIPPEGSLLPDTYVFRRGLERQALLNQMREAQTKLVESLWAERAPDLPLADTKEAVILASIVEKETGVPEERRQVAAVFVNRLRKKMRLQSDPTIIYGIVGGRGRLDRPIRQSDIEAKTEYNTYRIDGLPPTPIANPGRESLLAVLRPAPIEDLYFVADGSGGHVFARTLEEHRQNVRKWRKIELDVNAEDMAASDPAAQPVPAAPPVSAGAPAEEASAPGPEQPLAPSAPGSGAEAAPPPVATAPQTAQKVPPASATVAPAPKPKARPESTAQVATRQVPVPRPKPKRN